MITRRNFIKGIAAFVAVPLMAKVVMFVPSELSCISATEISNRALEILRQPVYGKSPAVMAMKLQGEWREIYEHYKGAFK
ncbi:hypothetical protein LCGC14_0359440 [marine sediment metagenome]|uniref:Twin-arginine translocation signal domain-containing protein n=1 Tax=marine sediment metagenome TaxID=412755 RepID=A0A0F9TE82_9ZZZZ|nr:hypothetical protein [Candidatus Aminicenantes bacterium]